MGGEGGNGGDEWMEQGVWVEKGVEQRTGGSPGSRSDEI